MTPDYVLDMTWNEISSALEYINKYETTERHYAKEKLIGWIWRGFDNLKEEVQRVKKELTDGA
jgi:hypothetical protein